MFDYTKVFILYPCTTANALNCHPIAEPLYEFSKTEHRTRIVGFGKVVA